MSQSLELYIKAGICTTIMVLFFLMALCSVVAVRSWQRSDKLVNAQIREIEKRSETYGQPQTIIQKVESIKK